MVLNKKNMANKNVAWVEPNFIYSNNSSLVVEGVETRNKIIRETIPPLENYCISVDLEVEISNRNTGGVNEPTRTILISWDSHDGKSNVSFFEGSKCKYNDKEINYLTTNPTTFGTFEDAKNGNINECFGINSIDISYNNYMVPEVTIEFTDIRGVSLFSPEELRHSGVNEEGVGGMIDSRDRIAGSFFKCFFTLPYPHFKMLVKGFYGEPVTYDLVVYDFRTRFDSSTGNFNATAKFTSYAFSFLNDVTMNALTVAPLCEYIGEQWWKEQIDLGRYCFTDNSPMIRIDEAINKVSSIKEHIDKMSNENENVQRQRELDVQNNKINNVITAHDILYHHILEFFKTLKLSNVNNILFSKKNIVLFVNESNISNVKVTNDIKSYYNTLKDSVKNFGNELENSLPFNENITFDIFPYDSKKDYIENTLKYKNIERQTNINFNEQDWYVVIYNGDKLDSKIESYRKKNENEITKLQKEISKIKDEAIVKALGFKPTIENITKMILAHFETLVRIIYSCSSSVTGRTASSVGINETDILNKKTLGPFPKVEIPKIHNGIESLEESWLGALSLGVNQPEVQLVEGLLKAIGKFDNLTKKTEQNIIKNEDPFSNTQMPIIVTPLDIVLKKNPYGNNIDFDNISDFIGKVTLRMFSVVSLLDNIVKDDYEKMGIADAYNFYSVFPQTSKRFLDRLCGSSDNINLELFISCLENRNDNEKIDGKWAWDNDESYHMISDNKLTLFWDTYCSVLPITNFNWDVINSEEKNSYEFLTTKYEEILPCENIFIIDENYENYSDVKNKMYVDSEQFSYIDKLDLEFIPSKYMCDFFYDDTCIFAKKFNSLVNDIDYKPFTNSHILPLYKHNTLNEAINSDSFNTDDNIFDDDFNTFLFDEGKREIDRKQQGSFSDAVNEIGYVSSYTIPSFRGIINDTHLFGLIDDDDKVFTKKCSIFGQIEYYDLTSDYAKALVFLDTLKLKEENFNMGGIRFNDYTLDSNRNIISYIISKDEPFCIMPYCGLLLLGGYFWREQEITKDNGAYEPLENFISENKKYKPHETITYDIKKDIFNVRQEIKNKLIKEFTKWVNSDKGFKLIKENFELNPSNSSNLTQKEFVEGLIYTLQNEKEYLEEFLFKNANDKFYENYISVKEYNGNLKLFNRETSKALDEFVNFYIKPCMVMKPTKFITDNMNDFLDFNDNCKKYLKSFLDKLKTLYKENHEVSNQTPTIIDEINTSEDIKINTYRYIKLLYDKWLSGRSFEEWRLENFYNEKWHFLDSFYNKIGDRLLINMNYFTSDVLYSQKKSGFSLLSFLSQTYARNKTYIYCLQNFMDLSKKNQNEKFHKMFKAIPYNEIDFQNQNYHPSFVIMYTNEFSSKLDIKGSDYVDDGFDINGDDYQLPKQIVSKRSDNGYKIPAFGVTYGKQYQHFFKNVEVSTENPIVTDEALKAQFLIAGMNSSTNTENGKKISFLGQDLYTVYSNNSYTCTVKMMGCAWIQPLMYFQLNNIPMFRGAYLIQKVTHHIIPSDMETTFVGTRMSKISTKFVSEPIFAIDNDQISPQAKEIVENILAKTTNDCKYAFYNPNIDLEGTSMPSEDFDLSLEEYEMKYGYTFDEIVDKTKFTSIKHLLGSVVKSEAEGQDKLGRELVAVVLFNRYMHFGKNLTKLFTNKQHALNKICADNDIYMTSAVRIFTESPMCLKDELTKVHKSIKIYNDGIATSNFTQPIRINEHILKSIDGYCTTRGYDVDGKHSVTKEPIGWWHEKAEYGCQHDGGGNGAEWGHVFVSGSWTKGEEHWQVQEKKVEQSNNSNPSEKAIDLYQSIKKTIETSKAIDMQEITMEKDIKGDRNVFYIIAKPENCMVDIFDAIVNTYYDYFSECNWIINSDGKELPKKIRVKTNEKNVNKKIISISTLDSLGNVKIHPTHEELNENFYTTLKKKYGIIDTNNKEIFKSECMNFNTLATNDVDWVNIANNFLSNNIDECGGHVNLPIIEGYTWDGNESQYNKLLPKGKFTNYVSGSQSKSRAAGGASKYAWENKKTLKYVKSLCGKCASAVRIAMEKGGGADINIISVKPTSACVYSKFLPTWGFSIVYEGFGPSKDEWSKTYLTDEQQQEKHMYYPLDGDIAVVAGKLGGTDHEKHGHIHIYYANEDYWVSDYATKNQSCYSDKNRPYIIYRWRG